MSECGRHRAFLKSNQSHIHMSTLRLITGLQKKKKRVDMINTGDIIIFVALTKCTKNIQNEEISNLKEQGKGQTCFVDFYI